MSHTELEHPKKYYEIWSTFVGNFVNVFQVLIIGDALYLLAANLCFSRSSEVLWLGKVILALAGIFFLWTLVQTCFEILNRRGEGLKNNLAFVINGIILLIILPFLPAIALGWFTIQEDVFATTLGITKQVCSSPTTKSFNQAIYDVIIHKKASS